MCGIAGAFNVKNASYIVSLMLKAIQHRGQGGAGITSEANRKQFDVRGLGLVDEVFRHTDFERELPGLNAIGHVRYATTGDAASMENVQPFVALTPYGKVALAHNGNLTNCQVILSDLSMSGRSAGTVCDTELLLRLLACSAGGDWAFRLKRAFGIAEGAYSIVLLAENGTCIAAADPYGFRPLSWVPYEGGYLIASETCAFDIFHPQADAVSIKPGTIVEFRPNEAPHETLFARRTYTRFCSFEGVYFSRPDSMIFDRWVYDIQTQLAIALARRHPTRTDFVVPVPDSSNDYALAYAQAVGIPFRFALIRNHYTGRTFITPGQVARELGVRMKQNARRRAVEGRSLTVVDDSIVRGTTSKKITALLRDAGAREVHMRIPCPPVCASCHWGIATHDRDLLIAARLTVPEMACELGLDSLEFLPLDDFRNALGDPDGTRFCYSCFTGEPPVAEHALPCPDAAGCADTET